MADQLPASFIPDTPPAAAATPAATPAAALPSSFIPDTPTGGGAMNFAFVNGKYVPIDEETTPHNPLQHAEAIGAPSLGDHYIDKPLSTMNLLDVVRRIVYGANAERPRSVVNNDPFGGEAFVQGKGPMPMVGLPETEVGPQTFTGFIDALRANRKHAAGRALLSDALNIKKAGVITEPEFDTALARIGVTHHSGNPIQFVDEVAQRARLVSHEMDEHVKGIADQFAHRDIPATPLRDIATAGSTNPIGGGGPGSTFVQQGRGAVLRLYPQLGHYEPIVDSAGRTIGRRLVEDPVSIPDAAHILTSVNKQLNDRLGPQAARRVRTDMIATDPTYAALDALATSLRKGIDQGLEREGVPGIAAFRTDQRAVIKLQQAAEKVEGKGFQKITRTSAPSVARRIVADVIPNATTAIGATQGPAGAVVGKTVGESIRDRLTGSLTRDQAVKKAYELMRPAPQLGYPFAPPAAVAAAGGGRAPGAAAGAPGAPPAGGGGTPGQPALPPVGLPAAPAAAGALPPEPWFREGEIAEPASLPGRAAADALPPMPPRQIGSGTKFVVDASGRVRLATKAGPQIPAETMWPRPAMAETYRVPKTDPSFVRAVKGTYAEVFKRAEEQPVAAGEALPAPAEPGAQPGVGAAAGATQREAARVRLRAARADEQKLVDETLDTLTRRYVDAGHPDHPDAIRAKLADDLRGLEELHRDNAAGDDNGLTLLRAIAKAGGISEDAETAQKGEIAFLKEFRDSAPSVKKNAGNLAKRRVLDTVRGVKGVFRNDGGLALDGVLEALKQEPGRFGHIKTINDLVAAVQKAATEKPTEVNALADLVYHTERDIAGRGKPVPEAEDGFAAFSAAVDEIAAEPVIDHLDTGEAQPRLPGAGVAGKGGGSTSMRAPQQATGGAFDLAGQGDLAKGTRVFFDDQTLHGTRTSAGSIWRDLGNGIYEVRDQQGGIHKLSKDDFRLTK